MESSLVAGIRDSQQPGGRDFGPRPQGAAGGAVTGNRPQHHGGVKGGTQLFTINEERGGLAIAGDDEGFIAPQPVAKRKANLQTFFRKNEYIHRPMEVKDG